MTPKPHARPHLNVLTPEQIEYLHDRSLQILSRVGVRVDSPRAMRVFTRSGGVKRQADDRVLIEPSLVEWAIQSAPSSIDVFNRRGEFAFRLGEALPTLCHCGRSVRSNLNGFENQPISQSPIYQLPDSQPPIPQPTTRFGIGVTNLFYQDPLTEEVTPFSRKYMEISVRLGDRLPSFDLISTVGIIQDYPRRSPTCTPSWRWSPTLPSRW